MPDFATRWDEFAPLGRHPRTGGYRRFVLTAEDYQLREWFAGHVAALGMELFEDRMGNQWAWWGDLYRGPGVVTGSHLDSVPDGGAFDGPLGVVSALLAVARLRQQDFSPDRPIGIVNVGDEEGADGLSMAEAFRAADRRPESIGTAIWPHGRWRVEFPGQANQAGTTRLADRQDAMLGYAEFVLAARAAAERHGCLATVGKVRVDPGGVNTISSAVTGWLEARGADAEEADCLAGVDALTAVIAELAGPARHAAPADPAPRLDAGR